MNDSKRPLPSNGQPDDMSKHPATRSGTFDDAGPGNLASH